MDAKHNILVLTADFPPMIGGLATYTSGLCQGFVSCGINVLALAPSVHKRNICEYTQFEFPVFRYPNLLFLREILLVAYLIYLIFKFRLRQILCVSWYPCGMVAMFTKWLLGVPYVVSVYGSDVIKGDLAKAKLKDKLKSKCFWLMKLVFYNARNIFSISNYTKQLLIKAGVSAERIKVVSPGLDAVKFSDPRDTTLVAEKYNLRSKEVILTVARLEDYKGQDMVIKSLKKVIEKAANIVYLIVGEGPDEQRLRALVSSLGLEGYVVFIKNFPQGHDELVQLYAAANIFIMVSRQEGINVEGFGIVFLEAGACGKPVIGGNSGGIADAVVNGQTGLLVDPLDVDAISTAILRFILDRDYAQRLGKEGQKRVREYFTWDKIAKKIWDTIDV